MPKARMKKRSTARAATKRTSSSAARGKKPTAKQVAARNRFAKAMKRFGKVSKANLRKV